MTVVLGTHLTTATTKTKITKITIFQTEFTNREASPDREFSTLGNDEGDLPYHMSRPFFFFPMMSRGAVLR